MERQLSYDGSGGGGLAAIAGSYQSAIESDAHEPPRPPKPASRPSLEGVKMGALRDDFVAQLHADNAKRGVSSDGDGNSPSDRENDLSGVLERVEASSAAVSVLDLSASQQFGWLSQPQKAAAIERIARGRGLSAMLLNSLGLDNSHALPIAAAVRAHTALQKLSLESNGLNEPALITIAESVASHPSLTLVSVANQKSGSLTQPAVLALIGAMEATPKLTRLMLGEVSDPTLRKRLEAASMHNLELRRRERVATGVEDTRAAAKKAHDWMNEARKLAASLPFDYGRPRDQAGAGVAAVVRGGEMEAPTQYVLTDNTLWRVATESERLAVFTAMGTNTVVTSFEAVNAFLNDPLACALGDVLRGNTSLTYISIESNSISSRGIAALAAGLAENACVRELKLANQHCACSQAAEEAFATSLEGNTTILHLTIDLRSLRARELINRYLTRNHELQRAQRVAAGVTTDSSTLGRFKPADWAAEAQALAHCRPFEFGHADATVIDQSAYIVRGNALWSRATHEERAAVLTALCTNEAVTQLDLWNSFLNDAHAALVGSILAANTPLTSLNIESNVIRVRDLARIYPLRCPSVPSADASIALGVCPCRLRASTRSPPA